MPFPTFLSDPELDDPTLLQQLIETGAVTEILSGSSGEAQHVNSLSDKLMIFVECIPVDSFILFKDNYNIVVIMLNNVNFLCFECS